MDEGSLSDTQRTMVLPLLQETNIRGKPYITVSAKGIFNRSSKYPNDGADFGPDTTKGATAPGQYGAPYTETTGIGEAYTYAVNNKYFKIVLSTGTFSIMEQITITQPVDFEGQGGTQAANASINGVYSPYNVQSISGWPTVVINNISTANTPMFYSNTYMSGMNLHGIIFVGNQNSILWFTCPSSIPNNANFDFTGSRFINGTGTTGGVVRFVDLSGYGDLQIVNYMQDTTGLNDGGLILGGSNCSIRMINLMNYNGYVHLLANTNTFQVFGGNVTVIQYEGSTGTTPTYIFLSGVTGAIIMPTGSLTSNGDTTPVTENINAQVNIEGSWINGGSTMDLTYLNGNYIVANEVTVRDCIIPSSSPFFTTSGGYATEPLETVGKLELINNIGNNTSVWTDIDVTYTLLQTSLGNEGNYLLTYKPIPTISTNPPVSGTAYQNTNPFDIRLKIPVTYSPTSTAAATLATGISTSSTVTTSTKVSIPTGVTAGEILTYDMVVPAGQYFELVATNATIGTVEVEAA